VDVKLNIVSFSAHTVLFIFLFAWCCVVFCCVVFCCVVLCCVGFVLYFDNVESLARPDCCVFSYQCVKWQVCRQCSFWLQCDLCLVVG
jgi:hypothetical protein